MAAAATVAATMVGVPLGILGFVVSLLRVVERSVGLAPPTDDMLRDENHANHALFRYVPKLSKNLAWRELGKFPTPVHRAHATTAACGVEQKIFFQVKREDLCSPLYGGQKVRTLQHQLAVCESRLAKRDRKAASIGVLGSGGSNQIVATAVHAARRLPKISALWAAPDEPDLDNTLNMLSTLSLSNIRSYSTGVRAVVALIATAARGIAIPIGGNNPAGALGHASAALELAEQIARGECDEVDAIYLAIGSSCTISGLIVGVALSRRLGQSAFRSAHFTIHGVIIHHLFAAAERHLGMHRRLTFLPLTIGHTVREACAALHSLGGPNVTDEALHVLDEAVQLHTDPRIVGKYGAHSDASRVAARAYDATGVVTERTTGAAAKELWLCGHFVAKAYAVMEEALLADPSLKAILWQTKSATQPRGCEDEWVKLQAMDRATKRWADKGAAESKLRQGSVNVAHGTPEDYRPLMTAINVGEGVLVG